MAFVLRDGIAYLSTNDFLGQAVNGLDATLLAVGWERSTRGQQVSGTLGATDRVYWSSGESGKESIYIRVTQTTANDLDLRAYSFWDPGTTAGFRGVGNVTGDTRLTGVGAALVGWISADKNGVGIVIRTAVGVYRKAYFGILSRQIAPQFNGQATISNGGAGAASGQPIIKVTSTSGFTVGQDLWIVNQTAGANAPNVERRTILTITPVTSLITFTANLTNAYNDGALVALDPQPVVLWGSGATETFAAGSRYMLNHSDAYPGPGTPLGAPFAQVTYIDSLTTGLFNNWNPDDFSQFPVEPFLLFDNTAGQKWLRGYVPRFARTMSGAGFADEDVVDVGTDPYMMTADTDGTFVCLKKAA
jgi:hypothetical protein